MSRKEQLNSFSDGIITDKHPLVQSKSALTDALNATMTTYNGNELILQNDMGNTTLQCKEEISKNNFVLKTVQLSPGFQPIGMKEHGGILYILSQKDTENADGTIKHEFEIGSFPGPDYTADLDESVSYTFRANDNENFEGLKTIVQEIPNLKVEGIENTKLYDVFPVKLLKSGNEDQCVLRVGQEFILVVENYDDKLSDKTTKKFYKLKFINLDDSNKDITDYVKFGTQFVLNPNQNSTLDFYYFPNIKTTSLGVKFELEDIEYFRLAENQTEGYDQARFPTFDFQNYELTFNEFEYESQSDIQMDSFNMKLTITDKTSGEKLYLIKNSEGENIVSETSGDNIVFLSDGKRDNFKYTFSGLTWELKHGNYILDYVIYPRWETVGLIETDADYSKVFEQHVIRESLDLTLIPSLWGGEETVSTHPYFELDKVLCGDLEWSNEEDTVDIGIFWQGKSNIIKFDFLAEAQKNPKDFMRLENIEPLGDISDEFVGLNEKNYILQRNHRDTQAFGWEDQVDILRFKLSYGWDKTDKLLGYISKDNLTKKDCPVYVYDHIHPVKSPDIQNIDYYSNIASVNLSADITTNAQKPSPNYYKKGGYVIGINGCHINENKTAASPVWQFQSLRFKGFEDIEGLDAEKSTIKQLSFPRDSDCIESTTDTRPWEYLPISMFSFNGLNWNKDESSDKENIYLTDDDKWWIQSYNQKKYANSDKLKNITLEEGSINIEILSKIYYIFAHNYKLPENAQDLVAWDENKSLMLKNDLNPPEEEIKNIKTFFQNSHFCPTEIKEASKYLNEPNRRTDTHKIKEAGGFVQFPSKEFELTESYIAWWKENNNGLGYYYWDYTIDNKTVLQFENLSKGTIQTAFLKTRSYDGDFYYFSTNNAYKTKEIPDFESEIKHPVSASKYNELRSNYKILKEQFKSETLSNYPILNSYPIESSDLYYNFITVSSKDTIVYFDKDDTISEGDICNISFYVGAFGCDLNNPVTLVISAGYTFKPNKKIFIQNSKLERDSNGKVIESGFKEIIYKIPLTDKYQLVQVVGELSNPRITFSVLGNGTATIRNIILTKVGTKPEDIKPRETCAISVYYNDRTFIDYSPITGDKSNKIWGGGKQYCYLPLPFFQIEDGENWCYTDDENGQTTINGEIYQIL